MTPIELHRAYTYQFVLLDANPYMFERYRGWWPVFVQLCREVDAALGSDKRGFRWVQVKEQFGVARFYWEAVGGDRAIENDIDALDDWDQVDETLGAQRAQMIRELVRTAENETKQRCIACGAPGEWTRSTAGGGRCARYTGN